jgi:surface antigen/LysM repeat protein
MLKSIRTSRSYIISNQRFILINRKNKKSLRTELSLAAFSPRTKRRNKRRLGRWSIVGGNMLLLVIISTFLLVNRSASQTVRSSTINSAVATAGSLSGPLDQLSSSQIAFTAAQMTKVPELTAVRNQADSEIALLSNVPSDTQALSKPQIISTSQKSRYDIKHYVVQPGESADSVGAKFNLTASSITGSNNLTSSTLKPGSTILIPPGNGLVYQVKGGDTVGSIVNKYGADNDLFVSVNDAERGVVVGSYVWIPNVAVPTVAHFAASSFRVASFSPNYGFNGYDYGYCTYYVASKIAVPSNWGNANTWDNYARATPGWAVILTPRPGAVAQTDRGGLGHVAIVQEVSTDGTQIKYSDMNGLAGWGRVGYSDWVSASRFEHYIVHQ